MQEEDPIQIKRLQRCINDLVSLLALPAVWSGNDPSLIVPTLLEALVRMLELDFAYARLKDPVTADPVEILRVADSSKLKLRRQEVGEMLACWIGKEGRDSAPQIHTRLEEDEIAVFPVPLGIDGEVGLIVVGSSRSEFPGQPESLLLSVAANQASIGLREASLLAEQRRIANDLERRVAERTAGLAALNAELRKEIAERKKIEERLLDSEASLQEAFGAIQKSEAKLRRVIDTIPTLAWCNLPDGPNEFLNKGWHEYTGLSPEDSHGWGWQAAFHPEDLPPLMKRWQELLISGEPGEIEARLRRHDGVYRWFLIRVEPFRDDAGRIDRWYGTSTDIDDRKRAEEQLRRSEAFLAEGQNLSRIGSFSWLPAENEIRWSEQLYRIFEFEPGVTVTLDLIGSRIHPEDLPRLYEMVEKAQRAASDFEYAHRVVMPDGAIKHLHMVAHGTRDSQGRLEYIGAVQDVTQRRLSEEALGKARSELANVARITSLGVLTASIAHEVNQPLSGIITNAGTCLRMLSDDPPNVDGARETARRTIRDGNRAADVIARLRTLYCTRELLLEPLDLNEAVREVISLSMSELQRNRVVVRQELADDVPRIQGDRVQLQQVILNLIRNASDAMSGVDDRPRELFITTDRDEDGRACLSVKDSGAGFEPEAADKLFEAFYTTKDGGMGIGLSVSRSIIEAHHGHLWVTRNEGPGTTFSFSIPCESQRTTEAGPHAKDADPASDAA